MIAFSVLSFASLSVATLAWFTANSTATFSTSQMTVDAGIQYNLYVYKNGTSTLYEEEPTFTEGDEFDDFFDPITSITNINGWRPGQKVTYAIEVIGFTGTDLYFYLSSYNSPAATSPTRVVRTTSYSIRMAWAINIYSASYASKESFADFFERQDQDGEREDKLTDILDLAIPSTVGEDVSITDPLAHATSVNNTVTFFYTLEYSDDSGTYFIETNGSGTPIDEPGQGAVTRYFQKSTSGNSNCYAGLTFTVDELTVTDTARS